jgi:hypothetical protein
MIMYTENTQKHKHKYRISISIFFTKEAELASWGMAHMSRAAEIQDLLSNECTMLRKMDLL